MMKILITGSSGYLGKVITKHLISKRIDIVGIDLREPENQIVNPHFKFIPCCITDDRSLENIIFKESPTHIIHLACSFNKIRNRKKELQVDYNGTKNMVSLSNKAKSVKQFIYFSSTAIYGAHKDNKEWISEDDPLRPGRYRYGLNKKLAEQMIFESQIRHDLQILCLRVSSVVGPSFAKRKSAVSTIINYPFLLKQWAHIKLQFLHEKDLSTLLEKIIQDPEISGIYNLAPDSYVTTGELAPDKKFIYVPFGIIVSLSKILWFLKIIKLPPASLKNSLYPIILDPAKLVKRYNFEFEFTSKEAFKEAIPNFKSVSEPV